MTRTSRTRHRSHVSALSFTRPVLSTVLLCIGSVASGTDHAASDPRLEEMPLPRTESMLDGKPLVMTLDLPHGYILKKVDDPTGLHEVPEYYGFVSVTYGVERIGTLELRDRPTAGYFEIAGKPEKVTYASSNPKVVKIDETKATFVGAGEAEISAEVAGQKLTLPFRVHRLPVEQLAPIDRHVKLFGLPDHKTHVFGSWPDVITRDDVTYVPDPGDTVFRDHWRYASLPGVAFVTTPDNLIGIRSTRWKVKGGPDVPKMEGLAGGADGPGNRAAVDSEEKAGRELRLARLLLESGKTGAAVKRLKEIRRKYPESDAAKEAQRLIDAVP